MNIKKISLIYFFLCDSEFDGLVNNIMQTADVSAPSNIMPMARARKKGKLSQFDYLLGQQKM